MAYKINTEECVGCGVCKENCPVDCITMNDDGKAVIDADACVECGTCQSNCPADAIKAE